jgi:hypothetical protein
MPVIGRDLVPAVLGRPQIRTLELFRGLAQRTKGRKTSYLDALPGRKTPGKTPPSLRSAGWISLPGFSQPAAPSQVDLRTQNGDETIFGTDETVWKQSRSKSWNQQSGAQDAPEASMNHSIHSADRATHLKIVVMALVAGIAVAGFAISARTGSDNSQTARVIKAGKPVVLTSSDTTLVR